MADVFRTRTEVVQAAQNALRAWAERRILALSEDYGDSLTLLEIEAGLWDPDAVVHELNQEELDLRAEDAVLLPPPVSWEQLVAVMAQLGWTPELAEEERTAQWLRELAFHRVPRWPAHTEGGDEPPEG